MFCMYCGGKIPEGSIFCRHCGKKQAPMDDTPSPVPTDEFAQLDAFFADAAAEKREQDRIEEMFDIQGGILVEFKMPDPPVLELVIPEGVTGIGVGAFSGCTNLTSIVIPHGVTIIEDSAFSSCTDLISVTIPYSFIYIGSYAFCDCANLSAVSIPAHTTTHVFAFEGCPATVIRR